MVVADGFERREFADERGFVTDSVRHLEVAGASAFNKLFAEKLEKRGFPATTNASHDFDDIFVEPACEPVGKPFPADFAIVHGNILAWRLKFVGMVAFSLGEVNAEFVHASCRTRHRAAFRRVAGGMSVERMAA